MILLQPNIVAYIILVFCIAIFYDDSQCDCIDLWCLHKLIRTNVHTRDEKNAVSWSAHIETISRDVCSDK